MKYLKLIGITQIVVAGICLIMAINIELSTVKWRKQLAETCQKIAKTTNMHKNFYSESVKNINSLNPVLLDIKTKTSTIADKFIDAGKSLQDGPKSPMLKKMYPKDLIELGIKLEETGYKCFDIATFFNQQVVLLQDYEKDIYPNTLNAFDETIQSFEMTSNELIEISNSSYIILLLSGVFFCVNGIALIIIAKQKQ